MDLKMIKLKNEIAKHHGENLFERFNGFVGFNDWIKENNVYGADADLNDPQQVLM